MTLFVFRLITTSYLQAYRITDGIIMKRSVFLSLTLFAITLTLGCASNQNPEVEGQKLAVGFEGESVQVFVGGRDRGFTPMTLRVRKSLGEYSVVLKKGEELVREFEVALESSSNRSPERQAVFMDLENDTGVMGLKTFGIEDLESRNDTLFYIPHYEADLSVDDVKYGLTLIITR